ncbi:hypothetical protein FFK22_016740 [Mycobacterium sp. KBS0706]|uniref:hypothetical protein n=1 Tax=Mycobacterium sp. KBS0706 TaxID=2578109 RepID=UPI00110FC75E|nr:hypothetical protein [Mycobacterium sp. KBS0706]TSD87490.1 hypothetical protein FFK22_016740 [Mycobacterium sp. KBS0706]
MRRDRNPFFTVIDIAIEVIATTLAAIATVHASLHITLWILGPGWIEGGDSSLWSDGSMRAVASAVVLFAVIELISVSESASTLSAIARRVVRRLALGVEVGGFVFLAASMAWLIRGSDPEASPLLPQLTAAAMAGASMIGVSLAVRRLIGQEATR